MSVRNYLNSIRKHWGWVVLPLLLITATVGVLSVNADEVYTARAELFVTTNNSRSATDLAQGAQFMQNQMVSYAKLANATQLEPVVEELGLDMSARELARYISVEAPSGQVLLYVSARAGDRASAARIANAVAERLAETIEELSPKTTEGESTVQVTVIDRATEPRNPSAPDIRRNVAAAAFAGLLIGLLLAVLRDVLDTRVRTQEDLETAVDVPLFGSVVGGAAKRKGSQTRVLRIDGPQSEDIRRIRANLQMAGRVDECQIFVFSSALPGEGKSFCATHVASAFAAAGSRVLLIDADLRRPTVAKYLGISGHAGLTEVLLGRARFTELCQQYAPNLTVLASGAVPPNPAELLASRAFEDLVALVSQHFEVVIVDSPPLLPVADTIALAQVVTGVVLVVDVTKTRRAQVAQSVEAVRLGGGRVVGAVLNRTKTGAVGASAYGYSSRPETDEDAERRQARLDAIRAGRRLDAATETAETPVVLNPQRARR
ncbi:MAG: polysaccharide biosynthesis tyrosine autokinase [Micrococcales bacterium]|nr:polysaccharide biosynthesis tyrosine autokinase [Micrococcales bacterium]